MGKPASFQWRENSTAIIILLLSFSENVVVVKSNVIKMLEVLLFCDREIRGLNEDISANFFGEEN